jgi:hypothetical protein
MRRIFFWSDESVERVVLFFSDEKRRAQLRLYDAGFSSLPPLSVLACMYPGGGQAGRSGFRLTPLTEELRN